MPSQNSNGSLIQLFDDLLQQHTPFTITLFTTLASPGYFETLPRIQNLHFLHTPLQVFSVALSTDEQKAVPYQNYHVLFPP